MLEHPNITVRQPRQLTRDEIIQQAVQKLILEARVSSNVPREETPAKTVAVPENVNETVPEPAAPVAEDQTVAKQRPVEVKAPVRRSLRLANLPPEYTGNELPVRRRRQPRVAVQAVAEWSIPTPERPQFIRQEVSDTEQETARRYLRQARLQLTPVQIFSEKKHLRNRKFGTGWNFDEDYKQAIKDDKTKSLKKMTEKTKCKMEDRRLGRVRDKETGRRKSLLPNIVPGLKHQSVTCPFEATRLDVNAIPRQIRFETPAIVRVLEEEKANRRYKEIFGHFREKYTRLLQEYETKRRALRPVETDDL